MGRLAGQQDDWRSQGACLHADPDVFFPISVAGASTTQVRMARAICAGCPVRSDCVDFAVEHREIQGIWGGTTDEERKKLRRVRARTASTVGAASTAA
jgi:WhiB family transcriptional regulator, redox-sensing transcriptional regulator